MRHVLRRAHDTIGSAIELASGSAALASHVIASATKQSIYLALSLVLAVFTACDSSSSSADPDPIAEVSSSSGDDDAISSSFVTDKGTSSDGSSKSSSSVKSGDDSQKSSSSSANENAGSLSTESSSSSGFAFKICEDGETWVKEWPDEIRYFHCSKNEWVLDSIVTIEKIKVYPDMDSVFNPEVNYGSFTDPRDGQVYKTIQYYEVYKSGNETGVDSFTVMAQNLNYADVIIDSTTTEFDDAKVEKSCYLDDPWYCENYFGARYSWSEAMGLPKVCDSVGVADNPQCNIELSYNAKVKGVCPEGWHVMNETEWKHYVYSSGIDMSYSLLAHSVWPRKYGSNRYGLSILPYSDGYANSLAYFWIPSEYKDDFLVAHYALFSTYSSDCSFDIGKTFKHGFLPIRCVMDEGDTFIK